VSRNHVAGKPLRAVKRIIDRSRNLGEVSVTHLHRRYGEELTPQPALFESLEVRHEEKPVLPVVDLRQPNRTAQREAVLVPLEGFPQAFTSECVLSRIELVVAKELEQRSVKLICSGLGRNIDLRCGAPEFGRKDSGLNLELLQRIDGWQEDIGVEVHVGILHAVQGKVVELTPLARDRNVLLSALSPLASNGLSGIRESVAHVRTQRDKLKEVPSVERHFDNAPVLDDRPDCCVLRGDERSRAGHLNGLAHLSNLECEVEPRRLLDLQFHVILCDGAKARQFDLNVVPARLQARQVVYASLVADRCSNEICFRIGDSDGHARNDRAARIVNYATNPSLCLRKTWHDNREDQK